ncbi:gp53-like domain-containing protein [Xenorhabdus anantnagensis]|uniref:Putative tail fiber protein gp53-like C-terminal domain-containing protein n=1 Tax=Xenorhabdus anantnagensis TaxID=3025875 RepID=A0ABT5LXQ6_9GAMM|nr:hypothetical protein [Xenorhabdus anantnagensis]
MTKAEGALQRSGGEVTGNIAISTDTEIAWRRNTDYAGIGFKNTGDGDTDSYMWFRTGDNGNEHFKWQHSLTGGQTTEWMSLNSANLRVRGHQVYHEGNKPTAAIVGAYTRSESNNRFIQLNTNTKTSGYILTKAANFLDDPSSRHLGRSGFLRPNGVDNLGGLAIHVAHPNVEGPQHARGISFSYGSDSSRFYISTYAFDEHGKFQGQKKILTEDDLVSIRNIAKKEPNGWWKCGDTGIIYQWGEVQGLHDNNIKIYSFSTPFPNRCVHLSAMGHLDRASLGGQMLGVHGCIIDNKQFKLASDVPENDKDFQYKAIFHWFAIGY